MLEGYISLDKAKEILNVTDDSLASLVLRGELNLVFFYSGGVASNPTIRALDSDDDSSKEAMSLFTSGHTTGFKNEESFDDLNIEEDSPESKATLERLFGDDYEKNGMAVKVPEISGHFSFECVGWFICNNIEIIKTKSTYMLTSKVYENLKSDIPLNKGDCIAFFSHVLPPDPEQGIIPINEDPKTIGIEVTRELLHIPAAQIKKQKVKKNISNEGQGDAMLILGAVMDCIKSVAKHNYTDASLISAITDKHGNINGISKSTLQKKFSESKNYLKQHIE